MMTDNQSFSTAADRWSIPSSTFGSVQSVTSSYNESEEFTSSMYNNFTSTASNQNNLDSTWSEGEAVPFQQTSYISNNNDNALYQNSAWQSQGWCSTVPYSFYQAVDYGWHHPTSIFSLTEPCFVPVQSEQSATSDLSTAFYYADVNSGNNVLYFDDLNYQPTASSSVLSSESTYFYNNVDSNLNVMKKASETMEFVKEAISEEELKKRITVRMCNLELWKKFDSCTVEMIVSKTGRNLFPKLSFNIFGLEPNNKYLLYLEIRFLNIEKYSFNRKNNSWDSIAEIESFNTGIKSHPKNANFPTGVEWMKSPFTFNLKLTNEKELAGKRCFVYLTSKCKYVPVLTVHRFDPYTKMFNPFTEIEISKAIFIATTSYQSMICKNLKIVNNPFAKNARTKQPKRQKTKVFEPSNSFSMLNQPSPYEDTSDSTFYFNSVANSTQQSNFPTVPTFFPHDQ